MDKPRQAWCKHACDKGCAIHDQNRPDVCTQFQCYWKESTWSEKLRPDKCGAIFRLEYTVLTMHGQKRLILVADLRDRYADLRRTLTRHLEWLYHCGHIVLVGYTAKEQEDCKADWRFQARLYPGLTARKLMTAYLERHSTTFVEQDKFYAGRSIAPGDLAPAEQLAQASAIP